RSSFSFQNSKTLNDIDVEAMPLASLHGVSIFSVTFLVNRKLVFFGSIDLRSVNIEKEEQESLKTYNFDNEPDVWNWKQSEDGEFASANVRKHLEKTYNVRSVFHSIYLAIRMIGSFLDIRSKADYGIMIFADKRSLDLSNGDRGAAFRDPYGVCLKSKRRDIGPYKYLFAIEAGSIDFKKKMNVSLLMRRLKHDRRSKLPGWILSHLRDAHLNLSTDMAVHIARESMMIDKGYPKIVAKCGHFEIDTCLKVSSRLLRSKCRKIAAADTTSSKKTHFAPHVFYYGDLFGQFVTEKKEIPMQENNVQISRGDMSYFHIK
ncbi:hypothetical protein M8C21_000262, partial [Ambrosia artemisiifolia]